MSNRILAYLIITNKLGMRVYDQKLVRANQYIAAGSDKTYLDVLGEGHPPKLIDGYMVEAIALYSMVRSSGLGQ